MLSRSVSGRLWKTAACLVLSLIAAPVAWAEAPASATAEPPKEFAKTLSHAFRKASEQAIPTVVTIHSKSRPKEARARNPRGENPFKGTPFEEFFSEHEFEFNGREFGTPRRQAQQGTGSGVIIDSSGVIVTNNHVVEGADEIMVRLHDGREFKAEDIKTDDQADLAVLRIKGAGTLPASKFGNSDQLDIGDWVLAIGNPFELDETVSAGIISGKGREISAANRAKFLQTDAAINPGNSGGPLINLDGEIVGINTAIATNTGSFNGIGFAVPSNKVKWVVDQLISSGSVTRAYLGVQIGDIAPEIAASIGSGVLVGKVLPGTPAAGAGVKELDVITKIDDTKVTSRRQLQDFVERLPIGSKHQLTVLRGGETLTLEMSVKSLSKEALAKLPRSQRHNAEPERGDTYTDEKLGLQVATPSEEELSAAGLEGTHGVLVTQVDPDGLAADRGLAAGTIITRVGKSQVTNVDEFKKAVASENLDKGILLGVTSAQEGSRFLVLK